MMKVNATLSIVLLVAGFLLFTLLNQLILSGARIDLTENRLYTLSEGTEEILAEIETKRARKKKRNQQRKFGLCCNGKDYVDLEILEQVKQILVLIHTADLTSTA